MSSRFPPPNGRRNFLAALAAAPIGGCAVFSGNSPIAVDSRRRELAAAMLSHLSSISVPDLTKRLDDRQSRLLLVLFDGTLNNKSEEKQGEPLTLIGHIEKLLSSGTNHLLYFPGPGWRGDRKDFLDAASGDSCVATAAEAFSKAIATISSWQKEANRLDVRIFVAGFSRGAATARHFMNLIEDRVGQLSQMPGEVGTTISTYALLIDTVATGQEHKLRLALSPSTEFAVHLIAADEPRFFFDAVFDEDENFQPKVQQPGLFVSDRLVQLTLPGAHSDLGAAYPEGIGKLYRVYIERILTLFGLREQLDWVLDARPYEEGMHDSRGLLDRLLLISAANEVLEIKRKNHVVQAAPISWKRRQQIGLRRSAFQRQATEQLMSIHFQYSENVLILLARRNNRVDLLRTAGFMHSSSIRFLPALDNWELRYRALSDQNPFESNWVFPPAVINAIRSEGSQVELSTIRTRSVRYIVTLVDGRELERRKLD
jgi:hypothetical protein